MISISRFVGGVVGFFVSLAVMILAILIGSSGFACYGVAASVGVPVSLLFQKVGKGQRKTNRQAGFIHPLVPWLILSVSFLALMAKFAPITFLVFVEGVMLILLLVVLEAEGQRMRS